MRFCITARPPVAGKAFSISCPTIYQFVLPKRTSPAGPSEAYLIDLVTLH